MFKYLGLAFLVISDYKMMWKKMSRFELASFFESSWFYPIYLQTSFSELSWTQHASQENPVGNLKFFFESSRNIDAFMYLGIAFLTPFYVEKSWENSMANWMCWKICSSMLHGCKKIFVFTFFTFLHVKSRKKKIDSSSSNWLLKRNFLKKSLSLH